VGLNDLLQLFTNNLLPVLLAVGAGFLELVRDFWQPGS
jgi:hypothetical protein